MRHTRRAFFLAVLGLLVGAGCFNLAPIAPRPSSPDGTPEYDPAVLERLVMEEANRARRRHRLPLLRPHTALGVAARRHSRDLASTGRFSHSGSDGSQGEARVDRVGVRYLAFGENLYTSSLFRSGITTQDGLGPPVTRYDWITPDDLARDAVRGWLESPGHRANLLHPRFERAGVGVALNSELGWIVTMDYTD